MCIRDSRGPAGVADRHHGGGRHLRDHQRRDRSLRRLDLRPVSYTHLRAHETVLDLVCRLLLEKKKQYRPQPMLGDTTLV